MASRYIFGFKTHTRYAARSRGVKFFTAYCNSDSDAIALGDWLEKNALPNYTKCSVSKVIHEAGVVQIPENPTLTDVNVLSLTLATQAGEGKSMQRFNVKIPIAYGTTGTVSADAIISQFKSKCCAPDGASFTSCVSMGNRFYNVVEGSGLDIN